MFSRFMQWVRYYEYYRISYVVFVPELQANPSRRKIRFELNEVNAWVVDLLNRFPLTYHPQRSFSKLLEDRRRREGRL